MKTLLHLLLTLCFLCVSGCIKLAGDGGSSSSPSSDSVVAKEGKVLNFNPTKSFELAGFLDDYPDATSIYIGVEGVTGPVERRGGQACWLGYFRRTWNCISL